MRPPYINEFRELGDFDGDGWVARAIHQQTLIGPDLVALEIDCGSFAARLTLRADEIGGLRRLLYLAERSLKAAK